MALNRRRQSDAPARQSGQRWFCRHFEELDDSFQSQTIDRTVAQAATADEPAARFDVENDVAWVCLFPEAAQRIIGLCADAKLHSRVDELADNANLGSLPCKFFAIREHEVLCTSQHESKAIS